MSRRETSTDGAQPLQGGAVKQDQELHSVFAFLRDRFDVSIGVMSPPLESRFHLSPEMSGWN